MLDFKSFVVGILVTCLFLVINYILLAFCDGVEGINPKKSKIYLFLWALGYKIHTKKLIKESLKNDKIDTKN